MRKTYQYKLMPTAAQRQEIERWLSMLSIVQLAIVANESRNLIIPQGEYCLRQLGGQLEQSRLAFSVTSYLSKRTSLVQSHLLTGASGLGQKTKAGI